MEKELATINTEEIDHSAINELDAASKVSSYVLHVSMNSNRTAKSSAKKSGTFQKMGVSKPVLAGIVKLGFKIPTPIQRATIPTALKGKDVVVMARTGKTSIQWDDCIGSGKTAAFLIPMVEKLKEHHLTGGVRGIVLSPTRELAYQSYRVFNKLSHYTNLRSCILVGGEAIESQFESISKHPDVIFATPGRLMHMLLEVPDFSLSSVQFISFYSELLLL